MNNSIIMLLNAIANALADRNEGYIAEYVLLASTLVQSGQDVTRELEELVNELERFIVTDTDPSDAEFNRVANRREQLVEQLRSSAPNDTGD